MLRAADVADADEAYSRVVLYALACAGAAGGPASGARGEAAPRAAATASADAMDARIERVFDEYALSSFGRAAARHSLERMAADDDGTYARVRLWFVHRMNGLPGARAIDRWQRGCPQVVPLLRAKPFWDPAELPCLRDIQASAAVIRRELLALRGQTQGFRPYRSPVWSASSKAADGVGGLAHDAGDWNVLYLFLHNMTFEENCALFPETTRLLRALPRQYNHAFFSALAPRSHVTKHNGPTNKKLRVQLPLLVPRGGGSRLRVGGEERQLEEGRLLVFDDSFEHEAWNDSDQARVILIFDIWHPDLSDAEVKFLHFLQQSAMRAERAAVMALSEEERAARGAHDNLYSILLQTQDMHPPADALWAGVQED